MTLLAVVSAKGSPGVTTCSCLIGAVWPRRDVLVVECDPGGGDLALRFGLSVRTGLASYLFARRDQVFDPDIGMHVQRLPGGLGVLVGPLGADAAAAIDLDLANGVHALQQDCGPNTDVIADLGRLVPGAPGQHAVLAAADRVLLVTRPDVSAVGQSRAALDHLWDYAAAEAVDVLVIGRGAFPVDEVRGVLQASRVFEIPEDALAAGVVSGRPGDGRAFARSRLVSEGRKVAEAMSAPRGRSSSGAA